jgi:hypothetical protein
MTMGAAIGEHGHSAATISDGNPVHFESRSALAPWTIRAVAGAEPNTARNRLARLDHAKKPGGPTQQNVRERVFVESGAFA